MYCAPTAVMDGMAYIANHGFPSLAPGPANWLNPGTYNQMSVALALMGIDMDTDPTGGTTGGMKDGSIEWLADSFMTSAFAVSSYYAKNDYSPTLKDMAKAAVAGDIVIPVVGWYTEADNPDQSVPKVRKGGHVLAMIGGGGSLKNFLVHSISFRDPASPNDGSTLSQSAYETTNKSVMEVTGNFSGTTRVQSRVVGYGSAYLDEYLTITPKFGLAADPLVPAIDLLSPVLNVLDRFGGGEVQPVVQSFDTATGTPVSDIAVHPEGTAHPYLVEGSNAVWSLDTLTGRSSRFAKVTGPKRLVFGPDDTLYVLLKRTLVALDRGGSTMGSAALPKPLDAIGFTDPWLLTGTPVLFGVAAKARRLYAFGPDLRPLFDTPIPRGVPNVAPGTRLAVDPLDGSMLLHADGVPSVSKLVLDRRFRITDVEEIPLEGAVAPSGLAVDDDGNLFLTQRGVLHGYDYRGAALGGNVFEGLPGAGSFSLVRSYTNFDPAIHTGPAWANVLPEDAVAP
jgi:hypothetical protein